MDWSLLKPHARYPFLRNELAWEEVYPIYYFAIVRPPHPPPPPAPPKDTLRASMGEYSAPKLTAMCATRFVLSARYDNR